MAERKTEIYLGKLGKIFGPFTSSEVDEMFSDGRINEYSWIWDAGAQAWKPLESMPAAAPGRLPGKLPSKLSDQSDKQSKKPVETQGLHWEEVEALCYHGAIVLSGRLDQITESGCLLVSHHAASEPKFSQGIRTVLNLFDKYSKKNIETSVRVVNVERSNSEWLYRLRWDRIPT